MTDLLDDDDADRPDAPLEGEAVPDPAPAPDWVDCWRCGKTMDAALVEACPYCRAMVRRPAGSGSVARPATPAAGRDNDRFGRLLVCYAAILATSVVYGAISRFGTEAAESEANLRERLVVLGVLEAIDTGFVVLALATIARPRWRLAVSGGRRFATWLLALPALAGVLWLNRVYHEVLITYAQIDRADPEVLTGTGLVVPYVLTHCVQPAIVEELFFRYLVLGMLLRVMGTASAVAVSSIMFGLAHVGSPLSIPLLTLVGVFLALARLSSGGLLLPMVLHFLHNLAVTFWDSWP
jgi:membrane protease YdiL (CAAX protease family)